jgi:hypothetical protein
MNTKGDKFQRQSIAWTTPQTGMAAAGDTGAHCPLPHRHASSSPPTASSAPAVSACSRLAAHGDAYAGGETSPIIGDAAYRRIKRPFAGQQSLFNGACTRGRRSLRLFNRLWMVPWRRVPPANECASSLFPERRPCWPAATTAAPVAAAGALEHRGHPHLAGKLLAQGVRVPLDAVLCSHRRRICRNRSANTAPLLASFSSFVRLFT